MAVLTPPETATTAPVMAPPTAGSCDDDGSSTTTASTTETPTSQPDTAHPYRRAKSQPCSIRLRANLLQKLGIDGGAQVDALPRNANPSRGTLLGPVKVTKLPLRDHSAEHALRKQQAAAAAANNSNADLLFRSVAAIFTGGAAKQPPAAPLEPADERDDEVPSITAHSSNNSLSTSATMIKGVRFEGEVTIIPIPTRAEYSTRIRSHLWDSAAIINANAQRNALEFSHDGWDWRKVLEEDEHYINPETGELIHPIHVMTMAEDSSDSS